ncbi:aminoglycoside phosphotransferase family protein [Amycolatopsis azurea]|uniref:Aminoglycoside phosphotransferase n=1 Tax=Amycolatopsis azurea DSM 43854 TaxID=1238180 RepID=M2NXV9_9PSEU|nr:aminoglycoside phosphotransferase family protein [Amycolatopsis azurea]EMD27459.1 Methionine aminopeptidase [Amycolatopsis azurea DSM 43854]OOC06446.1 aminoglycoside phosphotransferase [Amycolatopsis azurea DSM 43854]
MTGFKIPPKFLDRAADLGPGAAEWLDSLPFLAEKYTAKWQLEYDGEAMHGFVGVAQPVRRADGSPAVLKLGWPHEESDDEPLALSTWAGRGAVLMYDNVTEDGVLLLERLDATRSLETEPIQQAVETIGALARRLAVPAPEALQRSLREEAAELVTELPETWSELGEPFDREYIDAAVEICVNLGPEAGELMVNEDLHFENVLAGEREPWLVIDPKPLSGDLEFGAISILWNRHEESTMDEKIKWFSAAAGVDAERARAWTLVRAVQNWTWLYEDLAEGATPESLAEDPAYAAVPGIAAWALR